MLVTISPAKRLDWSARPDHDLTVAPFPDDTMRLVRAARRLTLAKLKGLMGLSDDLAKLNRARFQAFSETPDCSMLRPAVFAFAGDTYQGLEAGTLDPDSLHYAQNNLRILSGLYGVLRPMDGIQPYRLEMGSRLPTRRGKDLYAFWGTRIAEELNATAGRTGAKVLINCASQEYFGAVDRAALKLSVITPVFLEERGNEAKIVSFFAKRARGAMARFIVETRATSPEDLHAFSLGGYRWREDLSAPDRPVFTRQEQDARAA